MPSSVLRTAKTSTSSWSARGAMDASTSEASRTTLPTSPVDPSPSSRNSGTRLDRPCRCRCRRVRWQQRSDKVDSRPRLQTGAEVSAVFVFEPLAEWVPESDPRSWRLAAQERLDTEWTAPLHAAGLQVKTSIAEDFHPVAALTMAAEDAGAGLIVVAPPGSASSSGCVSDVSRSSSSTMHGSLSSWCHRRRRRYQTAG